MGPRKKGREEWRGGEEWSDGGIRIVLPADSPGPDGFGLGGEWVRRSLIPTPPFSPGGGLVNKWQDGRAPLRIAYHQMRIPAHGEVNGFVHQRGSDAGFF